MVRQRGVQHPSLFLFLFRLHLLSLSSSQVLQFPADARNTHLCFVTEEFSFVFFLLTWDDDGWWVAEILQEKTECVRNLDEASSPELFHSPQELLSIRLIVIAIIIAAAASASINSKAALSLSPCAKLLGWLSSSWRRVETLFSHFFWVSLSWLAAANAAAFIWEDHRWQDALPICQLFSLWFNRCNRFQSCRWELFFCEDQISELQKTITDWFWGSSNSRGSAGELGILVHISSSDLQQSTCNCCLLKTYMQEKHWL